MTASSPEQLPPAKEPSLIAESSEAISKAEESQQPIQDAKTHRSCSYYSYKQESLPAWKPRYTAATVAPLLFCLALLLVPVGVGLWVGAMKGVDELAFHYTNCASSPSNSSNSTTSCAKATKNNTENNANTTSCTCSIQFNIGDQFKDKRVLISYGLSNFFQNHRCFVISRDNEQLEGKTFAPSNSFKEKVKKGSFCFSSEKEVENIYPLGEIANSLFNDELVLLKEGEAVPLKKTGIAWAADKEFFKNPKQGIGQESPIWQNVSRPKRWKKDVWELDPENEKNNGVQNEEFIVWFRPAAMPKFRKLHRIAEKGLKPGNYSFSINYNYEVTSFKGEKFITLSTSFWLMGGREPFLGIAFIVVGSTCFLLALLLLMLHLHYGRSIHLDLRGGPPPT